MFGGGTSIQPACVVLFSALVWACAPNKTGEGGPSTEEVRSAEQSILDGEADPVTESVYALFTQYGGRTRRCTATLVARNLFLTARHCLANEDVALTCGTGFPPLVEPSSVALTNAPDTGVEEAADYPVLRPTAIHTPESESYCGGDVALLETEPVDAIAPLGIEVEVMPRAGDDYRAVGYGVLGEFTGGEGVRRARGGLSVACVGRDCPSGVAETEFLSTVGACEGDSGGPAVSSNGLVIGVLSRGTAGCETNVYSSTVALREWLTSVAEEVTDDATALPLWATRPWEMAPPGGAGAGGETSDGSGTAGSRSAPDDACALKGSCPESAAVAGGSCSLGAPVSGSPAGLWLFLGGILLGCSRRDQWRSALGGVRVKA